MELVTELFHHYVHQYNNERKLVERKEMTKKNGAHLLGIIVGEIERKSLAQKICFAKSQEEIL